jgi:hypothetical protein
MTSCKKMNCLITTILIFVFLLAFDAVVHGHLFKDMYAATASLWRSEDDMKRFWPYCLAYHFALAATVTCLYGLVKKGDNAQCDTMPAPVVPEKKCCPHKKAVCFGLKLGIIIGLVHASSYIFMPIPSNIIIAWFLASVVQGLGIGLILCITCKKKQGACAVK